MRKTGKGANAYRKYILPLFVVAASLVFSVVFIIVLIPTIVTNFGYEPILILLLAIIATVSSMLAILFYLILKGEIKI